MSFTFTYDGNQFNPIDLGEGVSQVSLNDMITTVRMYIYKLKRVVVNINIRIGTEHESSDLNLLVKAYTIATQNQSAWI